MRYICFVTEIKWLKFGRGLNRDCGYKYLWAEQTFRLIIILITVISRRKNQWYIVSQLLLEQNIWQAWSLVFLPTKLSGLLKIIFFISLKNYKNHRLRKLKFLRYMTFRSRWSCDIQFHKYAVHINGNFWW